MDDLISGAIIAMISFESENSIFGLSKNRHILEIMICFKYSSSTLASNAYFHYSQKAERGLHLAAMVERFGAYPKSNFQFLIFN